MELVPYSNVWMNEWMDFSILKVTTAANVLEYHHYNVTFWYGIWGNFVPTPLSAAELSSVSDSKLWCKCHFQVWWHLTPDLSISYQLRLNLGEKDEGEGRGREWDAPFTQIRGSAYGPPDLILSALDHWVTYYSEQPMFDMLKFSTDTPYYC